MNSDSTFVLDAALSLSDDDRANLAYQLLQSLKPVGIMSESDSGFGEELERRLADYESGKSHAAEWDDVAMRLRNALDARGSS